MYAVHSMPSSVPASAVGDRVHAFKEQERKVYTVHMM